MGIDKWLCDLGLAIHMDYLMATGPRCQIQSACIDGRVRGGFCSDMDVPCWSMKQGQVLKSRGMKKHFAIHPGQAGLEQKGTSSLERINPSN
jgi:hypothetical protein